MAEEILEGLAEAVAFGRENSVKGNVINIFDSVQDATGKILHLHRVFSMVMPDDNHKVLT